MQMKISVLGIDIGKNVCSLVGMDAGGKVVFAAASDERDADRLSGEAVALHRRHGGLLRLAPSRTSFCGS